MLIYSFICSIIFSIVMIAFIIASIYYAYKKKKLIEESEDMLNGFKTFDLSSIGGADDKNKKE